jgi:hypothetical protein
MDPWLRKTLQDAFAADDAARELYERDLAEPVERATSRHGIVYKTYINEPRHESEHEPHSETPAHRTMSQEASRPWNEWLHHEVDKRLQKFAEEFASLIGEESGKFAREERKRYEKMLGELRDEIGLLRAEITLLHAHKTPADVSLKGAVTPLRSARRHRLMKNTRSKRHAAALMSATPS